LHHDGLVTWSPTASFFRFRVSTVPLSHTKPSLIICFAWPPLSVSPPNLRNWQSSIGTVRTITWRGLEELVFCMAVIRFNLEPRMNPKGHELKTGFLTLWADSFPKVTGFLRFYPSVSNCCSSMSISGFPGIRFQVMSPAGCRRTQ
jgi:hypothetical protein